MPLAAWQIASEAPKRLAGSSLELEKVLEDWIAADPALVDRSLLIVQRQLGVDGGYLDLLGVDLQGRPTVIEIKRGRLIRETIAQAIDYASSISSLPLETLQQRVRDYLGEPLPTHPGLTALLNTTSDDEREIAIVVVGVGAEAGLDRMVEFLGSRFAMPISAVSFDVFELGDGTKLLVREETEPESVNLPPPKASIAAVIDRAGGPDSDLGRRMLAVAQAGEGHGLYIKPHKWSLMLAPQQKKYRHLMTVWRWADSPGVAIQYSADAFAEFFPIDAVRVRELLGEAADGRATAIPTNEDAYAWARSLDALFAEIGRATEGSEESSDGAI